MTTAAHPAIEECKAIRIALESALTLPSKKKKFARTLALGFRLLCLVFMYKLNDEFTSELKEAVRSMTKLPVKTKHIQTYHKLFVWYSKRSVKTITSLLKSST